MTSVRLNKDQEKKLDDLARAKDVPRSQIIKEALELYISREEAAANPYRTGMEFFGTYGSGDSDRSITYKERIRNKIGRKTAQ
ncbi:MAG: ribbon-helix-helix domain-containing protein [Balneolia bacterium]|nr:ribbon-helix-helix domain-containing protein [Balneolia bacterium]